MVALVTYADASGDDLGRGRTIAGTGTIRSDGTVGRILGVRAKATAARAVGADVLLFPAQLADQLAGFDARGMQLLPVRTLDEAIVALTTT
jgi:PDZ domain-containing protein